MARTEAAPVVHGVGLTFDKDWVANANEDEDEFTSDEAKLKTLSECKARLGISGGRIRGPLSFTCPSFCANPQRS